MVLKNSNDSSSNINVVPPLLLLLFVGQSQGPKCVTVTVSNIMVL
jgi:hypothetical protein